MFHVSVELWLGGEVHCEVNLSSERPLVIHTNSQSVHSINVDVLCMCSKFNGEVVRSIVR